MRGDVNLMPQHRVEYFLIHNHFQSEDTDNIGRLASTFKFDSDRCVDQLGLLNNIPSVKHAH